MEMSGNKKPYLPRERSWYKPDREALISRSPEGIDSILPNPVEDPIVSNNISYMEFDYTEDPYFSSVIDDEPRGY